MPPAKNSTSTCVAEWATPKSKDKAGRLSSALPFPLQTAPGTYISTALSKEAQKVGVTILSEGQEESQKMELPSDGLLSLALTKAHPGQGQREGVGAGTELAASSNQD